MIQIEGETICDPTGISQAFHDYYSELLGSRLVNKKRLNMQVINVGPIHSSDDWPLLDLHFTPSEIKEAMWSIDENKAPGPDG